jgi:hypothetical protein
MHVDEYMVHRVVCVVRGLGGGQHGGARVGVGVVCLFVYIILSAF